MRAVTAASVLLRLQRVQLFRIVGRCRRRRRRRRFRRQIPILPVEQEEKFCQRRPNLSGDVLELLPEIFVLEKKGNSSFI